MKDEDRYFDEDCIRRRMEKKFKDGTVIFFFKKRKKPILKPGSISTNFPNISKYLSIERGK